VTVATNDPPRIAVQAAIFSVRAGTDRDELMIPLVRRTREPFLDQWALPGGWLGDAEGLETAAGRTLAATTGLAPSWLEQLYTFDNASARVVSVVYWALLRSDLVEAQRAAAGSPENVEWFPVEALPDLAFDHRSIIEYAVWRLRNKAGYSRIAAALLPDEFTLAELRSVYETVLGKRLDPSNFRRLLEGSEALVPTEDFRTGPHRPARIFRYNAEVDFADPGPL